VVFNTGPYTVLPDNSILITANMQSETGFPSSHQLKSYVASKSRLKLAARAVLSADAGLLVNTVVLHSIEHIAINSSICSICRYCCCTLLCVACCRTKILGKRFKCRRGTARHAV